MIGKAKRKDTKDVTATVRALYVESDGGSAAVLATDEIEIIRAGSGIDALKRLQDERVDCVVVSSGIDDLAVDQFVGMVRERQPDTPVIIAREGADRDPVVEAIAAGASAVIAADDVEAIRGEIRDTVTDRRLERAIEQNGRLKDAIRRVATETAPLTDRVDIVEAIYDSITAADLYEFAWIGKYRSGSVRLQYPIEGEFDDEEILSLIGGGDPSFIERAVAQDTVQTMRGTAGTRSASVQSAGVEAVPSPSVATDGASAKPTLSSAAVPLSAGDGTPNILLLATTRASAFDGTETDLLGELGTVAGAALRGAAGGGSTADGTDAQRFAESLAHELRSPLGIAATHLELGRETGDPESFDRVESALERLEETIDGILEVTRQDDVADPTVGPLEDDVEQAWASLDDPDAELVIEGSAEFHAEHQLVVRALTNLFRNAVEHAPDPVTVRVGITSDGFYVEDDGPGIPPDRRDEVFDWGFTTVDDGTGIGLSIVNEVIDHHGWEVSISQGSMGGARFDITGIDIDRR